MALQVLPVVSHWDLHSCRGLHGGLWGGWPHRVSVTEHDTVLCVQNYQEDVRASRGAGWWAGRAVGERTGQGSVHAPFLALGVVVFWPHSSGIHSHKNFSGHSSPVSMARPIHSEVFPGLPGGVQDTTGPFLYS